MKTMMSVDGKKIVRITDKKASQLYSEGFRYISKSMWKEQIRDIDKPQEEKQTKKRHSRVKQNPIFFVLIFYFFRLLFGGWE